MVEAVWGEHKSAEQIVELLARFRAQGELALVTRVSPAKAAAVREGFAALPGTGAAAAVALIHHGEAACLTLPAPPPADPSLGRVLVVSGGSSDLTVAAEARLALACHGIPVELVLDVGVAGCTGSRGSWSGCGRRRC